MISVFFIGVGLSMDAFAIAVTNGMTLRSFRVRHALWMGLYFGGFQFLMPLVGAFLAGTVRSYVEALGPYISFALLAFLGGKMLWDELRDEGGGGMSSLSHLRLLAMAVATSIDALAAGVSLAFMEELSLMTACGMIGCTTFCFSVAGAMLGAKIPGISGRGAGIVGGLVLIAIGIKLLVEGVFL